MQTQELSRETLRRLAELRVDDGRILSVYVNLDPQGFGTGAARASAIRSVVDEASRRAREAQDGLSHEARITLRDDVTRVQEFLEAPDVSGARGLAIFASGTAGLFETLKLPRPVENEVVVNTSPFVEPLVAVAPGGEWCVLLANRRDARIFRGSTEELTEVESFSDDVPRRHDQGGWSQARFQRSVDEEAMRHLRRAAERAHRSYRRRRFDHLLLGGPEESYAALEELLHDELRRRLRGRVEIDVENPNVDEVLTAAKPVMESYERERQDELLARLQEGLGRHERAAAGLADVLEALHERRVEALLMEHDLAAEGVECPQCGWLGADTSETACPADGTELEQRDDVSELAVERALKQDAEVVLLRGRPELGPHGRIAAVLRF